MPHLLTTLGAACLGSSDTDITERSQSLGNVSTVAAQQAVWRVGVAQYLGGTNSTNKRVACGSPQEYHRLLLQAGYGQVKRVMAARTSTSIPCDCSLTTASFPNAPTSSLMARKTRPCVSTKKRRRRNTNAKKQRKLMTDCILGLQHFIELAPKPSEHTRRRQARLHPSRVLPSRIHFTIGS